MATILVLAGDQHSLLNFREELLKQFVANGHAVHCISPGDDKQLSSKLKGLGVTYQCLKFNRTGLNPASDLIFSIKLFQTISKIRPDSILAYTIKPVIFGLIAASLHSNIKRYAMITGLGYVFIGNTFLKAFLLQPLVRFLYQIALQNCDHVFFQNLEDLKFFEQNVFKRYKPSCSRIMGSGVNLKKYPEKKARPETFSFIMVARILRDKGVFEYLEAAKKLKKIHKDIEFNYIGGVDSNPSSFAKEFVEKLEKDKTINYFGWVNDVPKYLGKATIFVLPSYREGLPRSTLEAMAMGKPVITTDVPGCRDTVINNENGILVPARNVESLFEAMLYCYENRSQMEIWGKKSRSLVEEYFEVTEVNEKIIQKMGL